MVSGDVGRLLQGGDGHILPPVVAHLLVTSVQAVLVPVTLPLPGQALPTLVTHEALLLIAVHLVGGGGGNQPSMNITLQLTWFWASQIRIR